MVYSYRRYQSSTAIWVLIVLNLLLFVLSIPFPGLIYLMGLQPASFLSAPWTIVTTMFMHSGFGHIFANMLTLFFFGAFLTRLIEEKRFLIVYFLGGIVGSLSFVWLAPPYSVAVGASGAIYAVGGVLTVLMPRLRVFVFPIPVPLPLWAVVIGGFVIVSFVPGIAWQAHLGGLVFGLLAGLYFRRRRRYPVY